MRNQWKQMLINILGTSDVSIHTNLTKLLSYRGPDAMLISNAYRGTDRKTTSVFMERKQQSDSSQRGKLINEKQQMTKLHAKQGGMNNLITMFS